MRSKRPNAVTPFVLLFAFVAALPLAPRAASADAPTTVPAAVPAASVPADAPLPGVRRILVLGDSITYAGGYVDYVGLHLATHFPDRAFDLLDLGIPSETVEGLTEEGHPFPRPDVHERLDRTLTMLAADGWKPDLVLACYGMNDGIYKPLDAARFAAYRDGIARLVDRAHADGVPVTLLTPPPFDSRPSQRRAKTRPATDKPGFDAPFDRYDDVLWHYGDWLLRQRQEAGWDVIDLHGPMKDAELAARQLDPDFALAGDGIHPGAFGHWLMARQILAAWHLEPPDDFPGPFPKAAAKPPHAPTDDRAAELLKLVTKRRKLMSDAWLHHIGHKRPGMAKGLPIEEAKKQAAALDEQIRTLAGER